MNGFTKRTCQTIHELAFILLNEAKVQMAFFDFALDYAQKILAVPPIWTLLLNNQPSWELFAGAKPIIFCPIYINSNKVEHHHNNPECGILEIRVGIQQNIARWLFYHPLTVAVVVSVDVSFDNFVFVNLCLQPRGFCFCWHTITAAASKPGLPKCLSICP